MKRNKPTIGAKLYRKFAAVASNKSFVLCDPISWPARNWESFSFIAIDLQLFHCFILFFFHFLIFCRNYLTIQQFHMCVFVYVHINSWRYTLILNLSILIGRLQLHIGWEEIVQLFSHIFLNFLFSACYWCLLEMMLICLV